MANTIVRKHGDTVGVIALSLDHNTHLVDLCVGTSSGGPWLKLPLRIGSVSISYIHNFL